jgi:dihydropteroate synthase
MKYSFNTILIKISAKNLRVIGKIILKFIWKDKGIRIAETTSQKKIIGKNSLPNFKIYCIIIVTTSHKQSIGH